MSKVMIILGHRKASWSPAQGESRVFFILSALELIATNHLKSIRVLVFLILVIITLIYFSKLWANMDQFKHIHKQTYQIYMNQMSISVISGISPSQVR